MTDPGQAERPDEEVRFYLAQDASAPKGWVVRFMDETQREPSWEEIVLWIGVANLSQRVRELEGEGPE